ncbi:MAG: STAS domain-containing protein [Phycisphaerales bacterium]
MTTADSESFLHPQALCNTVSRSGVAVVNLVARSLRERQAFILQPHLNQVCDEYDGRLVIDASRVEQFTCAWVNCLITLSRRCRTLGGDLIIAGVPRYARDLFESTGLDKHLHLATTPEHAFAEFGLPSVSPWRLAVARLLDIPVALRPAA